MPRRRDQGSGRSKILATTRPDDGWIDESLNPDLDDIEVFFAKGLFLCAWQEGELVGTGAFVPEAGEAVRIVRMSTKRSFRRRGIGRRILDQLLDAARSRGYGKIVLETTETWAEVIAFYERYGFRQVDCRDGDAHFELVIV